MMKKSKRKNIHRRPPLSLLDKAIYWVAFFLSFFALLFSVYALDTIRTLIAFRDAATIAHVERASSFLALFLLIYIEISLFVYLYCALKQKNAIWGNSKIQYGKEPWDKNYFPLLDRRRRAVPSNPTAKSRRRTMLGLWCTGLFFCLLLFSFSLFGRDCMHKDNSITSYSAINRISSTYLEEDFAHLTLQTKYVSGYRISSYWVYEIKIEMSDGQRFSFSNRDFYWRQSNRKDLCLEKMVEIKALFSPDQITIKGADDVDKVAAYISLDESQTQRLHQLFEN